MNAYARRYLRKVAERGELRPGQTLCEQESIGPYRQSPSIIIHNPAEGNAILAAGPFLTRTCTMEIQDTPNFQFHRVTPQRLPDLAAFSQCHGKFRYCSCMRWRMTSAEFRRSSKEQRIAALEALACTGAPVGILAYHEGEPVAWCSVAPRESYAALERSRTLPRTDDAAVWAVTCFFVDRRFRRQGLTCALLKAAVDYARSQKAAIVEGYPVAPDSPSYTYMGSPETFRRAGFCDVTPAGQVRRVMRFTIAAEYG